MANRRRSPEAKSVARSKEPEASPASEASVVASPAIVPPAPERLVRIRNLTGQMIECSVLSESGVSEARRLDAYASSNPYPEFAIGDHTHSLVARGFLKLEPVR